MLLNYQHQGETMANSTNGNGIPSIIKKIDGLNHNKKIKLRYKMTDGRGYSLYLDLWFDGKRHYEFLKLYLSGKKETLNQDKETLRIASAIRDNKEIELLENHTGFKLTQFKDKASFIDYFTGLLEKKTHHNWSSCLKHLTDFAGTNLRFKDIDPKFCESFKNYLLSIVDTNTAQGYLQIKSRVKHCC